MQNILNTILSILKVISPIFAQIFKLFQQKQAAAPTATISQNISATANSAIDNILLAPNSNMASSVNVGSIDNAASSVGFQTSSVGPMLNIPARAADAVSGSQFCANNFSNSQAEREQHILQEFINGNIPDFLHGFVAFNITDGPNTLTVYSLPDVLSIGSNEDYIRMPMTPLTAQKIADVYNCTMPTRKLETEVWKNAKIKLNPQPRNGPYDNSMSSTQAYLWHNSVIEQQLKTVNAHLGDLISGHKKSLVLSNNLSPNNPNARQALFGWFYPNGKVIQDLQTVAHSSTYEDYAGCIRFISNNCLINGQPAKLIDILTNGQLCHLASDEGILTFLRY